PQGETKLIITATLDSRDFTVAADLILRFNIIQQRTFGLYADSPSNPDEKNSIFQSLGALPSRGIYSQA
ncbi:hypothetical protein, partial [Clostridium perfringens]